MRTLVLMLTLLTTGLAAAQEPIAPAVVVEPPARAPLLLPQAPQGWRYHLTDGPPVTERHWGLFAGGLVTLGAAWSANLMAGVITAEWRLDIPLLGPLLEMQRIGDGGGFGGFFDLILITDAAVQVGGLAMLIAGAATRHKTRGVQRIELVPFGAGAAVRGSF